MIQKKAIPIKQGRGVWKSGKPESHKINIARVNIRHPNNTGGVLIRRNFKETARASPS